MMLKERAEWLPELGYNAGLFNITSTGHEEIYPILPYNKASFSAAIDKLPESGNGPTMLQPALSSLREPLSGLSGKTAVIMFTDGNATVDAGSQKTVADRTGTGKGERCLFLPDLQRHKSGQRTIVEKPGFNQRLFSCGSIGCILGTTRIIWVGHCSPSRQPPTNDLHPSPKWLALLARICFSISTAVLSGVSTKKNWPCWENFCSMRQRICGCCRLCRQQRRRGIQPVAFREKGCRVKSLSGGQFRYRRGSDCDPMVWRT